MLQLLLVSIQIITLRMVPIESETKFISLKLKNSSQINHSLNKDNILCNHCKRTASNGVRCLGMCVADNDY